MKLKIALVFLIFASIAKASTIELTNGSIWTDGQGAYWDTCAYLFSSVSCNYGSEFTLPLNGETSSLTFVSKALIDGNWYLGETKTINPSLIIELDNLDLT